MTVAVNNWSDGFAFTGASANVGPYPLLGGRYAFAASATWGGGSVALQMLMPDGTTYVAVSASFTADNSTVVDLPPGTYRVAIATATAVQGSLARIPYRAA